MTPTPPPPPPPRNLAARAGAWSARHRKAAILGWIAFVVAAVLIGGAVSTNTLSDEDRGTGDSARADQIVRDAFPQSAEENVLVQSRSAGLKSSDPAFTAAVTDVVAQVDRQKNVIAVKSPLDPQNRGQISADGRSALVSFEVRGDDEAAQERIDPIIASVKRAAADNPQLRVEQFGGASAGKALDKAFADDFVQAEVTSLPLTLIILVLAFGALVAALIPLLLAFSSVLIAIGLTALPSQLLPVDDAVNSVILLIGMAVGVDYALFYLRRAREERHHGRSNEDALAVAAATSGRAVLVSGVTVMIAMSGMFLTGEETFSGFGMGTILVVLAAMIGSVTVLPAVLAALGDRVEKARVPRPTTSAHRRCARRSPTCRSGPRARRSSSAAAVT